MLYVFLDSAYKKVADALANSIPFDTEDDLRADLKSKGINNIDISAVGYTDKSICKDEIVEIWGDEKLVGKMIKVINEKAYVKSLIKWCSRNTEKYPDQCNAIMKSIK